VAPGAPLAQAVVGSGPLFVFTFDRLTNI